MTLEEMESSRMVRVSIEFTYTYDKDTTLGEALEDMDEHDRAKFIEDQLRGQMAIVNDIQNEGREAFIVGVPLNGG